MTTAAVALAVLAAAPGPRVELGDALPAGAVLRLGPTAFRSPGWVWDAPVTAPDGRRVALATRFGVWVWDAATGRRLARVAPGPGDGPLAVLGFHPAGDLLLASHPEYGDRPAVYRVDAAAGAVRSAWRPAGPHRRFVAASPDGRAVYSREGDNVLTSFTVADDLAAGRELWRRRHPDMGAIRPSPDGSRLVTWSAHTAWTADVLDAATGRTVAEFRHPEPDTYPGLGVAVGPRAERVVALHPPDYGASVFTAGPGPAYKLARAWYEGVFFRPDGRHVVFLRGRGDWTAEVRDAADGRLVSCAPTGLNGVATLSPDGKTLAVRCAGAVRFADVDTGRPRPQSPAPFVQSEEVWFLPDGRVASAGRNFADPVVWDGRANAPAPLPAGTRPPAARWPAGFRTPDGTTGEVVSPRGDRALVAPDWVDNLPPEGDLLLVAADGSVVARYARPDLTDGAVYRFAPDGRSFAVARGDGAVTVHDAATGAQTAAFRHAGGASAVALSADRKRVAVACGDGPILVFAVPAR